MYKGLRVAVVVPAYNEADNLPSTLATIQDYVDHILVVDDGSVDMTSSVAAEHARPGVEVLRHFHNQGVGAAVATGYRRAMDLDSDVAVVMAGAGEFDPFKD